MIIWRGLGILVVFFVTIAVLLAEHLCRVHFGPDYTHQHQWPFAAALAVAGIPSLVIGCVFNGPSEADDSAGSFHRLYYIPMQWWGGLLLVGGAIVFLVDIASSPKAASVEPPAQDASKIVIIRRK
jgi:hypothetical protein